MLKLQSLLFALGMVLLFALGLGVAMWIGTALELEPRGLAIVVVVATVLLTVAGVALTRWWMRRQSALHGAVAFQRAWERKSRQTSTEP